jgi:hypothetical protein
VVSGLEEAESWKTSPTPTPDADQGPVAKFNCGKEHEESKLKASAQCPKRRQWLAVDLCCSQGSPCHLASDKVTAGPHYCTSMYELTEHHQGLQTAGRTSGQTTINLLFSEDQCWPPASAHCSTLWNPLGMDIRRGAEACPLKPCGPRPWPGGIPRRCSCQRRAGHCLVG